MPKKGKVPIGLRITAMLALVALGMFAMIAYEQDDTAVLIYLAIAGALLMAQFFGRTPVLEEAKLGK